MVEQAAKKRHCKDTMTGAKPQNQNQKAKTP
jgi:hypothetical protein